MRAYFSAGSSNEHVIIAYSVCNRARTEKLFVLAIVSRTESSCDRTGSERGLSVTIARSILLVVDLGLQVFSAEPTALYTTVADSW